MWQQFLSSLASGAGSGLAGGIMGKLFGSGKQRIPSGFEMGKRQADYFQALYKGQLNPWELAGAGGQGEGGAAAPLMAGIQQRKSQDSNLKNMLALESAKISKDIEVAKIQADAHVQAAGTQPGSKTSLDESNVELNELKKSSEAALASLRGRQRELAEQEVQKIKKEIPLIIEDTKLREQETKYKGIENEWLEAEIVSRMFGSGGMAAGGAAMFWKVLRGSPWLKSLGRRWDNFWRGKTNKPSGGNPFHAPKSMPNPKTPDHLGVIKPKPYTSAPSHRLMPRNYNFKRQLMPYKRDPRLLE